MLPRAVSAWFRCSRCWRSPAADNSAGDTDRGGVFDPVNGPLPHHCRSGSYFFSQLYFQGLRNTEIDMPEPKQHTLEDDELFLVSFILLALGNGILIAITLMIWRNQALDV